MAFTGPALDAGVRAIFGFPMAEVAAQAVLAMQTEGSGDALAAQLEQGSNFHYVVHEASGMLSAQMEVSVAQALVRLRAHAFATGGALAVVAANVVGRRLRFSHEDG